MSEGGRRVVAISFAAFLVMLSIGTVSGHEQETYNVIVVADGPMPANITDSDFVQGNAVVFRMKDTTENASIRITLDADLSGLKKSLAAANEDAEEAMARVDAWRRWATVAKGKLASMPPSGMPRTHAVVSPQPRSEAERSRSPRRQVQLARLEFAPSQVQLERLESAQVRVPEYDG